MTPAAPFEWITTDFGPALVCRALEPFARHIFTTRTWTLGAPTVADVPEDAWNDVAAALDVDPPRLFRVRQCHGADVAVASEDDATCPNADIVLSPDSRRAVAIRTADCVPLLIVDRRTRAVAAAHAGWRGLAARVPQVAVAALERAFGCRPADSVTAAGPSIGACCYEVGRDVREAFESAGFGAEALTDWFLDRPRSSPLNSPMPGLVLGRAGHWFFDGWAATRDQLEAAGVPSTHIFAADLCTASHPQTFCSYRRDGAGAGRLAAAIRGGFPRQ